MCFDGLDNNCDGVDDDIACCTNAADMKLQDAIANAALLDFANCPSGIRIQGQFLNDPDTGTATFDAAEEPEQFLNAGDEPTVWFKLQGAPQGMYAIDTMPAPGSTVAEYDTVMDVFNSDTATFAALVAGGDDIDGSGGGKPSRVLLDAITGTTYYGRVYSWDAFTEASPVNTYHLNAQLICPDADIDRFSGLVGTGAGNNDDLANAKEFTKTCLVATGSTGSATTETNEPQGYGNEGVRVDPFATVWVSRVSESASVCLRVCGVGGGSSRLLEFWAAWGV